MAQKALTAWRPFPSFTSPGVPAVCATPASCHSDATTAEWALMFVQSSGRRGRRPDHGVGSTVVILRGGARRDVWRTGARNLDNERLSAVAVMRRKVFINKHRSFCYSS